MDRSKSSSSAPDISTTSLRLVAVLVFFELFSWHASVLVIVSQIEELCGEVARREPRHGNAA